MKKSFLPFPIIMGLMFSLSFIKYGNAQNISLNFSNMNPHVGQKLEIRLIDKSTLKEVDRNSLDAISQANFSLVLKGEMGHSYFLQFYADFNKNGVYNAPPMDHAWQMEVDNITAGMTMVNFMHNTNFVDIKWKQNLVFKFKGMTPHKGQKLELAVRDINLSGKEVGRVSLDEITEAEFDINLPFLELDHSYIIDFYADFNKNGVYDAPPMDHAWRIPVLNVKGDETMTFSHNTNFVDIKWKQLLTINFNNMTPHLGQKFEIRVRDVNQTGREVGRISLPAIIVPDFTVSLPYLDMGRTYIVDYYADLNKNGTYNAPPMDHAWREILPEVDGDAELNLSHNTKFKDIGESNILTLGFSDMTPHIGQQLELRVMDLTNGKEVDRVKQMIRVSNFKIQIPGLKAGNKYNVDYYADLNKNGLYNAPPMDHAWRETFMATSGDQKMSISHNTNFTDIKWPYLMTLQATNMTPHLGQKFELKVIDIDDKKEIGSFSMPSIMVKFFFVRIPGITLDGSYNVDFYADFNKNGVYDAPPVDHAWRVEFDDDDGDEIVPFRHNTNFTDIMFTTATNTISNIESIEIFPNPVEDHMTLRLNINQSSDYKISLSNLEGLKLNLLWSGKMQSGLNEIEIDRLSQLKTGLYFLQIENNEGQFANYKIIKK